LSDGTGGFGFRTLRDRTTLRRPGNSALLENLFKEGLQENRRVIAGIEFSNEFNEVREAWTRTP
jgi:hypothetical protein